MAISRSRFSGACYGDETSVALGVYIDPVKSIRTSGTLAQASTLTLFQSCDAGLWKAIQCINISGLTPLRTS